MQVEPDGQGFFKDGQAKGSSLSLELVNDLQPNAFTVLWRGPVTLRFTVRNI